MSLYNPQNSQFNNANLNSIGSSYAAAYGHDITLLIQKETRKRLFDASPQQFYDLAIFNQIGESISSANDEFNYKEFGYQRQPVIAVGTAAAVTAPTTQTFVVTSIDNIAQDTMIAYPNGSLGTVISVDPSTTSITVAPLSGQTLPAVAASDSFANISSIEADAIDGFAQYFRLSTIERNGYIQLFSKAIRYGAVEMWKMEKGAIHPSFISDERDQMFKQFRIDFSNAFWMGRKGQAVTAAGDVAKTTDGVFTMMQNAGSPSVSTTVATLSDAFEDVILSTQYGNYGEVKFAYMTPRMQNEMRKVYTDQLIRYTPQNQNLANLHLEEVNIGSTRVVIVPMQRFASAADFYPGFENRIVLLDHTTLDKYELWGTTSGETLDRSSGIAKSYKDTYVCGQLGVAMNNPLASGYVDVTF